MTVPPDTGLYVIVRSVRNSTTRADLVYSRVHGLVPLERATPTLLSKATAKELARDLAELLPNHNVWAIRPEEF
jgi:hypothetical protein